MSSSSLDNGKDAISHKSEEDAENQVQIPKEMQKHLDLMRRLTNLLSFLIISAAIATICMEVFSMYRIRKYVMYAAGIVGGCILAPSVVAKQYVLARMETLRCAHNKIRMEINRFMEENNVSFDALGIIASIIHILIPRPHIIHLFNSIHCNHRYCTTAWTNYRYKWGSYNKWKGKWHESPKVPTRTRKN